MLEARLALKYLPELKYILFGVAVSLCLMDMEDLWAL